MLVKSPSFPSTEQCRFLADRALRLSGVRVDPAKRDFIQLRVSKRLKALDLDSFDDYIRLLKSEPAGPESHLLVEALTTHTTSFFREGHQYDWLEREGISRLAESSAAGKRQFTIWSAACSTGAELWSAGMVLMDAARKDLGVGNVDLVGTDISHRILRVARNATYSETEIDGIPEARRSRYLMQSKKRFGPSNQHYFRIVPELRQKARFEPVNLSRLSEARRFDADVVFLRNVLIYFEEGMQRQVLNDVIDRIRPGGILFTGHSEAVPRHDRLRVLNPSTYEKI